MTHTIKESSRQRLALSSLPATQFLRSHPLASYFILAYGLQWLWEIPVFAIWHQQKFGAWVLLSPSIAGFLMACICEGTADIIQLLRRMVQWRADLRWYLVVILCFPALLFLGILFTLSVFAASKGRQGVGAFVLLAEYGLTREPVKVCPARLFEGEFYGI